MAASPRGVCAIELGARPAALRRRLHEWFPAAALVEGDPALERWTQSVVRFVDAPSRNLELPLDLRGTAFQRRVWRALRRLPPGATVTYAELARRIGRPRAARAVAGACAANPLALAVPCHRAVRGDGTVSGYRWGVERKRALLRRERAAVLRRERAAVLGTRSRAARGPRPSGAGRQRAGAPARGPGQRLPAS